MWTTGSSSSSMVEAVGCSSSTSGEDSCVVGEVMLRLLTMATWLRARLPPLLESGLSKSRVVRSVVPKPKKESVVLKIRRDDILLEIEPRSGSSSKKQNEVLRPSSSIAATPSSRELHPIVAVDVGLHPQSK